MNNSTTENSGAVPRRRVSQPARFTVIEGLLPPPPSGRSVSEPFRKGITGLARAAERPRGRGLTVDDDDSILAPLYERAPSGLHEEIKDLETREDNKGWETNDDQQEGAVIIDMPEMERVVNRSTDDGTSGAVRNTTNPEVQVFLFKVLFSLLEAGLSIFNSIRSEAWRLESFHDHVFMASAIGEAVGCCLGIVMSSWFKSSGLLGHPLLNVSDTLSADFPGLFHCRGRDMPDDVKVMLCKLVFALGVLTFTNYVFLCMYLPGFWAVIVVMVLLFVAQRHQFFTGTCKRIFHALVQERPLIFMPPEHREHSNIIDRSATVLFSVLVLVVVMLCSPPALELLESGLLMLALWTGEEDDECSDGTTVTVLLATMDIVMTVPVVFGAVQLMRWHGRELCPF